MGIHFGPESIHLYLAGPKGTKSSGKKSRHPKKTIK